MIPTRDVNGGVTASVTGFAAVNRNARYPDLAFTIIDFLMSTRVQQNSSFYEDWVFTGMPLHMDMGSEKYPIDGGWYMSEANFKEYEAARSEITEVKFTGPVDLAIWKICGLTPEELEGEVHEQYVLIEMLLAES